MNNSLAEKVIKKELGSSIPPTDREQHFTILVNNLLISLDKIAVSRDMGFTRAEAIRAIEAYQQGWRGFKRKDMPDYSMDRKETPIYGPKGVRLDNGPLDK